MCMDRPSGRSPCTHISRVRLHSSAMPKPLHGKEQQQYHHTPAGDQKGSGKTPQSGLPPEGACLQLVRGERYLHEHHTDAWQDLPEKASGLSEL